MKKIALGFFMMLWLGSVFAQTTFPRNGVYDERDKLYAFKNATIYVDYQTKIEQATLIIKDGKVVQVGQNITIPKGAMEFNLQGKYVYPSFIGTSWFS